MFVNVQDVSLLIGMKKERILKMIQQLNRAIKALEKEEKGKEKESKSLITAVKRLQEARCRKKTYYLIKTGKLVPTFCNVCKQRRVVVHHKDYSNPKDVVWLCKKHHLLEHKAKRSAAAF
jgi:hypothetical protein